MVGRVIWGKTPMVTHPITALSKRVLAGIATARSPVRNISAVAKVVGRGVRECVSPAHMFGHLYDQVLLGIAHNPPWFVLK